MTATATAAAATAATAAADELRAQAAAHEREAEASFERCDTDGFLSQWASRMVAQEERLQADIEENGGKAMFLALFDLDGNLLPAILRPSRYYGRPDYWTIYADDDCRGRAVAFFTPSQAKNGRKARATDARKGYYVGYVMAPAKAELRGSNAACVSAVPVRTGPEFSRDVEIIDNGQHGPELSWEQGRYYHSTDVVYNGAA
ncbi:hypothetical protein [Nonomuraea salmonea]|uniref:Uncharacterized protein n=1 Tax=Nonomuraea salmonea TaxID=46181 RepID=A0ABV5P2V0_9ACTN